MISSTCSYLELLKINTSSKQVKEEIKEGEKKIGEQIRGKNNGEKGTSEIR